MPRGRHAARRGGVMVKVEEGDLAPDPPLDADAAAEAEEYSPPLSASFDDEATDSEGEGAGGGEPRLKKGPWTPEEDNRLRDYVVAHGEGNWNQVQRNAGLNRCGKSCRLRWANHLRPDLKKCAFSEEEVDKIIGMHRSWGNKWAKMSACLPGRTDNEIKNFWNTRLKRLQRVNLPIYPEHLSRVPNQDMNCHTPEVPRGRKRSNEFSQDVINVNSPIVFEHFDYKKQNLTLPENPLKRHSSTGCIEYGSGSLSCVQIPDQNMVSSTDFTCGMATQVGNAIARSHLTIDGNLSTFGTLQGSVEAELPSFQYLNYLNTSLLYDNPSVSEMLISEFIPQETHQFDVMAHKGDGLDGPTECEGCFEETIPRSYDQVAQFPSVIGVDGREFDGYPLGGTETTEFGSSAMFTSGVTGAPSDSFTMPDASLEANFFNEGLQLSEDESTPHISVSVVDKHSL